MPRNRNTKDAGYSGQHPATRAEWQQRIDQGEPVHCWRCNTQLYEHNWDLGHDDWDRTITRGPECRPCNRSAAAHKKNYLYHGKPLPNHQPSTIDW